MNILRKLVLLGGYGGLFFISQAQADQVSLSLTLKEALQKANSLNLQVMMANARLEQAIARISQSQSELLPHFEGTMSGARQSSDLRAEGLKIPIPGFASHISPYNNFDARLRVSIALFDPSSFERFQAAKKGENLSEAQMQKTREDVLALVANLYIDAKRRSETLEHIKFLLDRDQMGYSLTKANLSQGLATELDLNQSKTGLDQTKYEYAQAQIQAMDARMDLESALQIPLDQALIFVDDRNFINTLKKNAIIFLKDQANADMALAVSQIVARKADEKAALADFLPKISGNADYGRMGESPSHGSNTYFVGLQASLPIWEGGAQQAQLKEVKGQIKEAQENLTDAKQQEELNMAKAEASIEETKDLLTVKLQGKLTAQRSLGVALHANDIGSGNVFQVRQSRADLAMAQDDYSEAEATSLLAYVDLLHAEGHLRDLMTKED